VWIAADVGKDEVIDNEEVQKAVDKCVGQIEFFFWIHIKLFC